MEADTLSRVIWDRELDVATVKAIIDAGTCRDTSIIEAYAPTLSVKGLRAVNIMGDSQTIIHKSAKVPVNKMTNTQWGVEQFFDEEIQELVELYQLKLLGSRRPQKTDSNDMRKYLKHKHQLMMRKGLLYRKVPRTYRDQPLIQFCLPKNFRQNALVACHDEVGHMGIERSFGLLEERFYWPGMQKDMEHHVKNCDRCLRFKQKPQVAEMCPIQATHPLELVHMDFLKIEAPKGEKDVDILVMTDHFTRYAQAFVTPSQKAPVVAKTLWENSLYTMGYQSNS